MATKSNQFKKLSDAHKKISDGYKQLAKASESGIECEYAPKVKNAGFKR